MLTVGLRPETLLASPTPLLQSILPGKPCLVYEIIVGPHSLDRPQWALNDRGFYPRCRLKLTRSPTTNWTVLKNIQN